MQPYVVVDRKPAPDGTMLELVRHGDSWIIRVGGHVLMSSRMHGSEEELARLGFAALAPTPAPHVLVGGLGLGFTLQAVLAAAGPSAAVVVSELVPAIVEWNQGPLGPLAGNPLQDPRVSIALGSVAEELARPRRAYDLVLLDVDNGPAKVAHAANEGLYGERGSRIAHAALTPGGALCVWSATSDPRYVRTLERAGFRSVREEAVRAHGKAGARHTIFVAQK